MTARILIVEDNRELREALSTALSRQYETVTACDVPAALVTLDNTPVDLVLLDVILPRGTAFDVLEVLARRTAPRPRVIIMSALSTQIDLTPYAGIVAGTLMKPFHLRAVEREIGNALAGTPEPVAAGAGSNASILLVDDDQELREGMGDFLRRFGYRVKTAPTVAEAEALLSAESFDMVISDWIMPGAPGVALLHRLKAEAPGVPVLLMTAHGTPDFARHMLGAGAADVLLKPFPPKALAAAVEKCLQAQAAAPAPAAEPPLDLAGQERAAIVRALEATGGNKVKAAKLLGISRAGLYIKLKVYDL